MLRGRDFRQNLLINPHIHVGMSLEEHYGLNLIPNVKFSQKYDFFGEIVRYLTIYELNQFFDNICNCSCKLMFQVIYELGCGESGGK
jgi:hypothetical protein